MDSSCYFFLVLIAVLCHAFVVLGQIQVGLSEPTDKCVDCLCIGSTGCNRTFQCDGEWCGMFRISKPYWQDGGSLIAGTRTNDEVTDWKNCAMNEACARQVVKNYMFLGRQDCNKDQLVDCIDFAWIHNLGRNGCGKVRVADLSKRFMAAFNKCLVAVPTTV